MHAHATVPLEGPELSAEDHFLHVPLEDHELMAEVHLTVELMIAATEADGRLDPKTIDILLGL